MDLVSDCRLRVALVCRLFGRCRHPSTSERPTLSMMCSVSAALWMPSWRFAVRLPASAAILRAYGIAISMTEDYCPTDNAVAERANGIIKQECLERRRRLPSFEQATDAVRQFIRFYNYRRPHMSIGYKVPAVAHREQGEQKKMWKGKNYHNKSSGNGENTLPLQTQRTRQGNGPPKAGTVY